MPYSKLPALFQSLRGIKGPGARALEMADEHHRKMRQPVRVEPYSSPIAALDGCSSILIIDNMLPIRKYIADEEANP